MKIFIIFLFLYSILVNADCKIYKPLFKRCVLMIDGSKVLRYKTCNDIILKKNRINCAFKINTGAHTKTKTSGIKNTGIIRYIKMVSKKHKLDYRIIYAIIQVESSFNENAVSRKGAVGYMQLMPSSFPEVRVKYLKDKFINIKTGVKYFKYLLKLNKYNYKYSLMSYNIGFNAFKRYKKNNFFPEAGLRYVEKIEKVLNKKFNISISDL